MRTDIACKLLVARLNRLADMARRVTLRDYDDWIEGGKNYQKFEYAVRSALGNEVVDKADKAARTGHLLDYALCVGPRMVGGVDLKKLGGHTIACVRRDVRKYAKSLGVTIGRCT